MNKKLLIGCVAGLIIVVLVGIFLSTGTLSIETFGKEYGIPDDPPTDPGCEAVDDGSTFGSFDRLDCYRDLAKETGNPAYCAHRKSSENLIYSCMYYATDDFNYCLKVEEDARGHCELDYYYKIAKEMGDPNQCTSIGIKERENECFFRIAEDLEDSKLCERITEGSDYKALCQKEFDIILDPEECINDNTIGRVYCYRLGKSTAEISACPEGIDDRSMSECLRGVAEATLNPDLCNSLTENSSKNECLVTVAKGKSDYTICRGITSGLDEHACYQVFYKKGIVNMEVCKGLMIGYDCFRDLAIANNNLSICNELGGGVYEDMCIREAKQVK